MAHALMEQTATGPVNVMLDMRGTIAPRRAPGTRTKSATVSPVMTALLVVGLVIVLRTTSLVTGREYPVSPARPGTGDCLASTFALGVFRTLAQGMGSAMMVGLARVNAIATPGGALLIVLSNVLVS